MSHVVVATGFNREVATLRQSGIVVVAGGPRIADVAHGATAAATGAAVAAAGGGVLVVVGGPQYRAGSPRQFTLLARSLAEHLQGHPAIDTVYYPGLPGHPGHDLAKKQMRGFGGMLSLAFSGGAAAARAFAESTHLFQLAESLGGVESLVNYPSEMTHASVRGTELEVPDNIIRLSVGIEDVTDLIDDVEQALPAR